MPRVFRFTPARRSALRKAQAKSARKRKGLKSKDTFGPYLRQGVRWLANTPTGGTAGTISNFIEGKKDNRPSKWQKLYRDQSGKKRKKR